MPSSIDDSGVPVLEVSRVFPEHDLIIPDVNLPGWEVLHVYQRHHECNGSTILLLRRTVAIEEPYAVAKIMTLSRNRGKIDEGTTLAKIPPHPNIIKLHSILVDVPLPRQVTLLLEFCAGGDFRSFSKHAWSVQKYIPEVFLWRVLYQTLVALQHLDHLGISHNDLHLGNLFLRAVEGDVYPDVVLGDFEFSSYKLANDWSQRYDFQRFGKFMRIQILKKADEIAGGTAPYSKELKDFVLVLSGGITGLTILRARMDRDMIPLAKKMAYGNNRVNPRMPSWMIAYFAELRNKTVSKSTSSGVQTVAGTRESREVLGDTAIASIAKASAALGRDTSKGSTKTTGGLDSVRVPKRKKPSVDFSSDSINEPCDKQDGQRKRKKGL